MMFICGDGVNLVNLEGIIINIIYLFINIYHSWNEEYFSHPTRISMLDEWLNDEDIDSVVCGSRFTALLTSNNRLILLSVFLSFSSYLIHS